MSKAKSPPPQWESSGERDPLAQLGWPRLPKEAAARVIELVRPKPSQRDDCLRDAAISVQWIMRKTASTRSAGERKAALHKVADNIRATIKSIEDLPTATQDELDPEALRRTLELTDGAHWELQPGTLHRLLDRTLELADKIAVTRSGGKSASRIDAAKKRAAADCALNILLTWGSRGPPTLTRYRPYFELAALLFELATGKRDSDVERACARVLRTKSKPSARPFEMFDMLFEFDGAPKVFEDND